MSLKCIDCKSRELVTINPEDEYFALSYVWGNPTSEMQPLEQEAKHLTASLRSDVPQVIEDAITVVSSLGKRYLWVDKYCIDQEDMDTKHYQIKNMNRVYEGALATIIAGTGADASSGLPGVANVSRKSQPSVHTGKRLLVSTLPSLKDALGDSKWRTRGWTYQEGVLSRRCLVFTEHQLYFVCSGMSCCEAVSTGLNSKAKSFTSAPGTLSADIFGYTGHIGDVPRTPLMKFAEHVAQYTSRHLTYENDVMDAFRGLLAKSPFHSYYGIPIAPSDFTEARSIEDFNLGFARGLFWLPGGWYYGGRFLTIRRKNFPSWSWVGWKGSVEFPEHRGNPGVIKGEKQTTDTKFWAVDEDGQSFDFTELSGRDSNEKILPELSNHIDIEAWIVQFRFQPGGWNSSRVCICKCHPNSTHSGALEVNQPWGDVILLKSLVDEGDEFHRKLLTKAWTSVLLFQSQGSFSGNYRLLLIVEEYGDIARRIGAITIEDDQGRFCRLPKERKRIRLG
jgi:hypothetical protein